jgi:CheY-like chemotaxis protein
MWPGAISRLSPLDPNPGFQSSKALRKMIGTHPSRNARPAVQGVVRTIGAYRAKESTETSHKVVVLVVEDEPLLRMMAACLVEDAGFESLEAANADEAVRILEARSDIRIVFTDIDMPGSMDGMKLAAAVRGRWPPTEIIVTSGHYNIGIDELPPRGVFFRKPYRDREIIATLQRMAA